MIKFLIQWRKNRGKKELYFVRYLISKFKNFSRIFPEFFYFLWTFSNFDHIYENATPIFEIEIYINAPPISKVKIYRNDPTIFKEIFLSPSNFLSQKFTEMPLCTI